MDVKIKENSLLAKIAALNFKNKATGITFGNTIHLHKTKRVDFLKDTKWVRHELEHVLQFKKYGVLKFTCMYLLEILRKRYWNNKWEIAARNSETDTELIKKVSFK